MNILASARWFELIVAKVRELDPRMEAQMMDIMAKIALNEGITYVDLTERVGLSGAAVSRNITKLGRGSVKYRGLNLIETVEDPYDMRSKQIRLSPRGRQWWDEFSQLLAQIADKK